MNNFFYLQAIDTKSVVKLENTNGNTPDIKFSKDGEVWYNWDYTNLTIDANTKMYFKGDNGINFSKHIEGVYDHIYSTFTQVSGGKVLAGGNIMSLLDDGACTRTEVGDYCFYALFKRFSKLDIDDSFVMPATTLGGACYYDTFSFCSSLTKVPALPATNLSTLCYRELFSNCYSLTTAPALPATTLGSGCYKYMYANCSSLTTVTLLPATTLAYESYYGMFDSCRSLNSVTCLAEDISATNCTVSWLKNVSPTGTFIKSENMSDWTRGDSGIPTGWNVENYDPQEEYSVTLQGDNCTLTGGGSYQEGTSVTISCVPNTGYDFVKWSDGNTNATRTITVNSNITLTAMTEKQKYLTLQFRVDSVEWVDAEDITLEYVAYGGSKSVDIKVNTYDVTSFEQNVVFSTEGYEYINRGKTVVGDYIIQSYDIKALENQTFGEKSAKVYFTITSGGLSVTKSIDIEQEFELFTIPIWRDTYYTDATSTFDYTISVEGGGTIYSGRAYVEPGQSNIKVNVAKICQDYLNNEIKDGNIILSPDGIILGSYYAVRTFYMSNSEGEVVGEWTFRYDWSYENTNLNNATLTRPINGIRDARMIGICTSIEDGEYYKTEVNNGLYPIIGCGDFALYYLQRNGGYAAFLIDGNVKQTDNYERYTYNMAFNNTTAQFEEAVYHNQIKTNWQMSTGWLSDNQSSNLAFNLLSTNRCFLHNLNTNEIIPVLITNSSAEYKTFKNNGRKMVKYTINLENSQSKQYL